MSDLIEKVLRQNDIIENGKSTTNLKTTVEDAPVVSIIPNSKILILTASSSWNRKHRQEGVKALHRVRGVANRFKKSFAPLSMMFALLLFFAVPNVDIIAAAATDKQTTTTVEVICESAWFRTCYEVYVDNKRTKVKGRATKVTVTTTTYEIATAELIVGSDTLELDSIKNLPTTSIFIFNDNTINEDIPILDDTIGIGLINAHYYYSEVDGQTYYICNNPIITNYNEWLQAIAFFNNFFEPTEFNIGLRTSLAMLEIKVAENVVIDIINVLDGIAIVSNHFVEGTGEYQIIPIPVIDPTRIYGLVVRKNDRVVGTALFNFNGYHINN